MFLFSPNILHILNYLVFNNSMVIKKINSGDYIPSMLILAFSNTFPLKYFK